MTIHAANPDKSQRLAPVLAMLRRNFRVGATTLQLSQAAGSMDLAVSTTVSEIRARGYKIECVYEGRTSNGKKIYRYFYKGVK